jgi:hypothetical protein
MRKKNLIERILASFSSAMILLNLCTVTLFAQDTNKALLWKITSKNLEKPSYLFGTIHITCAEDAKLSEAVKNALNSSAQLILELDMDDPSMMVKMQKLSLNLGMKNFSTDMSQENKELIEGFYKKHFGLGLQQLGILKPFVLLSMMYSTYLDCEKQAAYETVLLQAAAEDNKEILGLETVERQMGFFNEIPEKEQIDMLVNSIKEHEKNKNDFAKLRASYYEKDIDALYQSFKKYPEYRKYEDLFLTDRNNKWIAKIEDFMAEKPSFIGVGAAHLASENGVINLLRKVGYTVTPVGEEN